MSSQSVDSSNLILPAGDVRIGSKDYNVYANSQFPDAKSMNAMPLKSTGNSSVLVADVGHAEDSGALQYNIVRIDGQRSVYVPVFKQSGGSNTITIVDGIKDAVKHLVDIPAALHVAVVFDQSVFVKMALANVSREAGIGLVLTGVMILVFLGSPRATVAVLLAVPLSMVVCLLLTDAMGGSINTMLLGGLALVFSRLIDNGVIVLENIYRHMEMGKSAPDASDVGGTEVSMAVLAATFTTAIVFFPVMSFKGVSKYIFTPLALGVVLSIFASYFFAMTVVPLFCAKFVRLDPHGIENEGEIDAVEGHKPSFFKRFLFAFNTPLRSFPRALRAACLPRACDVRERRPRSFSAEWPSSRSLCFPSSAAPTFPAPIPASSSSTCACPAARALKSATNTLRAWKMSSAAWSSRRISA